MKDTYPANHQVQLERRGMVQDPSFRQMLGASAATAAVILSFPLAGLAVGKADALQQPETPPKYHPSEIVGDVWSLVLSEQPAENCNTVDTQIWELIACKSAPDGPRLLVEQCHRDVTNARHQLWTVSFDDTGNKINHGCYADWVAVGQDLWSHQVEGSKIRFAGNPGSHLEK